jgi:hypothetical protein
MNDGAKPRDLEDRTFEFAQSVRAFVKQLPRTVSNTEDVKQTNLECRGSNAAFVHHNGPAKQSGGCTPRVDHRRLAA